MLHEQWLLLRLVLRTFLLASLDSHSSGTLAECAGVAILPELCRNCKYQVAMEWQGQVASRWQGHSGHSKLILLAIRMSDRPSDSQTIQQDTSLISH